MSELVHFFACVLKSLVNFVEAFLWTEIEKHEVQDS